MPDQPHPLSQSKKSAPSRRSGGSARPRTRLAVAAAVAPVWGTEPPALLSKAAQPHPWAQALGHEVADKRILILRGIAGSGSISQAAREAGVSYKAAWQAVATLTNLAGVPLVERVVGGAGGGGARLTAHGAELLKMAQAYDSARRAIAPAEPQAPAGPEQAVAGLRVRTSMRNQLPGTVQALHPQGRQVWVQLSLGLGSNQRTGAVKAVPGVPGLGLWATLTQESVELLDLQPGVPAIVMCKATAVRVQRWEVAPFTAWDVAPAALPVHGNGLPGVVSEVFRAEKPAEAPVAGSGATQGDEVSVTLQGVAGGALALVGFAPPGVSLRRRQRVWVQIQPSAVVLALAG